MLNVIVYVDSIQLLHCMIDRQVNAKTYEPGVSN